MALSPPARWPGGRVLNVAVAGGEIIVETLGAGPPLLMLHGWTLDRRMWRPQLPLAEVFTLVGIDRRGFGQSTAPADLAAEPDDVLRVADALGFSRFHLLGMSQGGRVALALAARAPDRLMSLALQGTALDGVAGDDENLPTEAMAAAARRGDVAAVRALVRGHRLMRVKTPAGIRLVAEMLNNYEGCDLRAPGQGLPVVADFVIDVTFPVMTIVGARDTAQRLSNAQALVDAGAERVILQGVGHLCNMENLDEFNAAVRANITYGS
jgi:pimeloyl-ACP methyl ester carboxylesterase